MFKKFLESFTLKDILFIIILIVIVCFLIKKNKKEKFSQITADNLEAINNLGEIAKKLNSGGNIIIPGNLQIGGQLSFTNNAENFHYITENFTPYHASTNPTPDTLTKNDAADLCSSRGLRLAKTTEVLNINPSYHNFNGGWTRDGTQPQYFDRSKVTNIAASATSTIQPAKYYKAYQSAYCIGKMNIIF